MTSKLPLFLLVHLIFIFILAGCKTDELLPHEGYIEVPSIHPLATPIFQSSTFVFDNAAQGAARFAKKEDGYIYTRMGNPNQTQLAKKIAALENAEVFQVHVLVDVQPGVQAGRVALFNPRPAHARLKVAEVLLIHVGVAVEIRPDRLHRHRHRKRLRAVPCLGRGDRDRGRVHPRRQVGHFVADLDRIRLARRRARGRRYT